MYEFKKVHPTVQTASPIFKGALSAPSERDSGFANAHDYALQFLHYAFCLAVVDKRPYG